MRGIFVFSIVAVLIVSVFTVNWTVNPEADVSQQTIKASFNKDWKFRRHTNPPSSWEQVNLPHTTFIEPLVVNDQWQGISFYQKNFELGEISDKKVFLYFEGVMHSTRVWVNCHLAKEHVGGYLPFTVDLTEYALEGSINHLTVEVRNQDNPAVPPGKPLKDLDFNYYGGIYRDVHLIVSDKLYITDPIEADKKASGGLLFNFHSISQDKASGTLQVHLQNDHMVEKAAKVQIELFDPYEQSVLVASKEVNIRKGEQTEIVFNLSVDNPHLWSPTSPGLYNVQIDLLSDGKLLDRRQTRIGIRKHELTKEGFFLNGEKMFIRGTNRHQEYPYIGYAISDRAQFRDAVKIKNAGFDFVRLSHYPQDEAFLDACDELGLIVMNCIPGWQFIGEEEFIENSFKDCRELVRRDRNHPSVMFWELSLNESNMTAQYMLTADSILREELPFENVLSAGWIDHEAYDLFIPARQHASAPDYWNNYDHKGRQIFIAEYGDWEYYAHNAGFNQKAFEGLKPEERTSRQLREYGEKRLLQQALNFQEAANSNRKSKNTIGHANWVMFDYNRGYSNDLESSGISDIFRLPKFSFFFYQSQRPPLDLPIDEVVSGPMVKVASYWNKESPLDIKVYSNCEEVALFLNDSLLERKSPTRDLFSSHLLYPPYSFKVSEFIPGKLSAIGYINGEEVALDEVSTPGEKYQLKLWTDTSVLPIDSVRADVVFVHAEIVDQKGVTVPNQDQLVNFELAQGQGKLIGANPDTTRAGIASILLRTERFDERIKIVATSHGVKSAEMILDPLWIQ